MKIISAGITDVGRRRSRNEDAFLVNDEMRLFVVADGMGGHVGGSLASTLAVTLVESEVERMLREDPGDTDPVDHVRQGLAKAIASAGKQIHGKALDNPEWKGMGTTVVVLLVVDRNAFIAHVGDSRVYLVRDKTIRQMTDDHSLVAESVRDGLLTEEQAKTHSLRNVITRALGFNPEVEVDVQVHSLAKSDRYLLCSDGLSGKLDDHEMLDILDANPLMVAPRELVELACARGGEDNITVVLARVDDVA